VVSLIVDEQGNPQRMTIVRPLGHGFLERLYALLKAALRALTDLDGGAVAHALQLGRCRQAEDIRWLH
jgi:hypothetical protein